MGRSGGSPGGGRSSGGGSRSSGGFGGGRSSGGFSGGGRSSSSYRPPSSSSRPASRPTSRPIPPPRPTYRPPVRPVVVPMSTGRANRGRPAVRAQGAGCMGYIMPILLAIVLVMVLSFFAGSPEQEVVNTVERTPLVGQVNKTDWYRDDLNWISNKQVLISGLESFYKETGVQPYVMMIPYTSQFWNADGSIHPTNADAYLEEVYDSTFTDEGHFIFAYFSAKEDSKEEMEGEMRYLSGYAVDTIMDAEAVRILWGFYSQNYYDLSLTLEQMIGNTFAQTGKLIMSKPTNEKDVLIVVIWAVVGLILVGAVVVIVKTIAKRKKEKEDYNKELLQQPLNTFGSEKDTSDIEKKYEK